MSPKKPTTELFKKASLGDTQAQFQLGLIYYSEGRKGYKEAIRWFEQAAQQGHAIAQFFIAGMYKLGQGMKKNEKEAIRWFEKSAQQGHAQAQYNLATMYQHEDNIDLLKAFYWYEKAAQQGHAIAQYMFALMHIDGEVIPKDLQKASYWVNKARENGLEIDQDI